MKHLLVAVGTVGWLGALFAETFAWQDVGVVRPSYWTYLRFNAVQPGVVVDALRLQLLKNDDP